jgi:hypothetical protein
MLFPVEMLVMQVDLAAKHQQVEVAQLGLMALVILHLHKLQLHKELAGQVTQDLVVLLVLEALAETEQNLAPYMDQAEAVVGQTPLVSLVETMVVAAEVLLLRVLDQLHLELAHKASS